MNKSTINSAINHLSLDPKMNNLIGKYGKPKFDKQIDPFSSLSKTIIYQQLSGKAAQAIYKRFLNLFNNNHPSPNDIIKLNNSSLSEIGLSQQKIIYINNLATFFIDNGRNIDFCNLSNDEIRNKLISIKGIGQWTIDMFLMFNLYRTDVLPVGDLGIKKALKILLNLNELPNEQDMIKKSKPWQPYRTIACWYLWNIVDDGAVW